MNRRALFLTLALGLGTGLVACRDQGMVAPEDGESTAEHLVATFDFCDRNPDHRKCQPDDGGEDSNTGTVWFQLTGDDEDQGLVGGPEAGRPIQVDNAKKLDMKGPSAVYSALTLTHATYDLNQGPCRVDPGGASETVLQAVADAMWMAEGGPGGTPGPEDFVSTRILIDKKKLGEPSPDHFISVGYDTGDPNLGWVWLGVGNEVLQPDIGYVTVSGPEEVIVSEGDFPGTYQKYVFSGGPVRVSPTAFPVNQTPSIVCPLLEDVVVLIKFP